MFNFEKLDVWHKAIAFADRVYVNTNQMRRAAVSIPSNLAEGTSRASKIDLARFIEIAGGSLYEVVSQSFIAKAQGFLTDEQFQQLLVPPMNRPEC